MSRSALALALLTSAAFGAEGLRNLPSSSQSQGMIGGKIALSDDPSVVRLNPASMSDVDGNAAQLTAAAILGENDYRSASGASDSLVDRWIPLAAFNGVWRPAAESPWTFGFGTNAPFGLSGEWPRDGLFKYNAPYEEELIYLALNPAVAYRFNDRLSLGVGLEVVYSKLELKQDYPWSLVTTIPGTPDGSTDFEADGWGLGPYLGANWSPAEKHRLSLVARLPVEVEYSGSFNLRNIPGPLGDVFSPESDFRTDITYPGSIALGYRFDPGDRIRFGFEYEWIQNSVHDDVPLRVGANQPVFAGSDELELNWSNSYTIGTGLEWDALPDLTLRAGYLYSKTPVGDRDFTTAIVASDRHILSAGGTYEINDHVELSLSYIYSFFEDRTVLGNKNSIFDGDYETHWESLTTSFTYRW